MRFGTFHLMEQPFTKTEAQVVHEHLDQMRLADEIGFDSVWLTEHHFSSVPYVPDVMGEYGLSTSPFAVACAVSQITSRVRIGTAVKVLPLDHPLRIAEDVALADIMSNGRIDCGLGTGYRQYEFDGLGVPADEKRERFFEGLDIIMKAFTEDEFEHQGRFWQFPRLKLVPKPLQKPNPPIWIATRLGTRELIDFAVRNGYSLLSAWAPPAELRQARMLFDEARAAQGRSGDPLNFPCIRHVFVAETDADAERLGSAYVDYYMRSTALFRPIGAHERDEMVFGGPDTCIAKLRRLRDQAGINKLICWMNFGGMPQELVQRSMRLMAEEVIPVLRREGEVSLRAAG